MKSERILAFFLTYKSPKMKKKVVYGSIALIPILVAYFLLNTKKTPSIVEKKVKADRTYVQDDSLITLIAVGDIMMGTNYPNNSKLPPKGLNLLDSVKNYLRFGDITFGNLEGTVLNSGGIPKSCSDPSVCYAFRQPTYVIDHLVDAHFNLMSVANNHMGDFGEEGRTATCSILNKNNIAHGGLEIAPWDTMTVKGLKIGFTGFAPNSHCQKLSNYDLLKSTVKMLDKMCDIVIVSFHGGAEGSSKSHVPRMEEIFLGENRGDVYKFAHMAIDAGADVVLGHGPHVTRAVDYYKGRFITYSMGNFCTYGSFNLKGISGIAPIYQLQLRRDGSFKSGKVIPIRQIGEGGPLLDRKKSVFNEILKLTQTDFPEIGFTMDDEGNFFFK